MRDAGTPRAPWRLTSVIAAELARHPLVLRLATKRASENFVIAVTVSHTSGSMVSFPLSRDGRSMRIPVEEYVAMAGTCEELAKKTPDSYSKHVLERSVKVLRALSDLPCMERPRTDRLLKKRMKPQGRAHGRLRPASR